MSEDKNNTMIKRWKPPRLRTPLVLKEGDNVEFGSVKGKCAGYDVRNDMYLLEIKE